MKKPFSTNLREPLTKETKVFLSSEETLIACVVGPYSLDSEETLL